MTNLVNLFTIEECIDIENELKDIYVTKAKNAVIDFLHMNGISVNNNVKLLSMIHTKSTNGAKSWHYDDLSIVNFIINIKGKGTKILIDKNIVELERGCGVIIIGEEGYKFCKLKPILHCAPESDTDRILLKIMIDGSYDASNYFSGNDVCEYNSVEYIKRNKELEKLFLNDIQIINNL